MDPKLNDAPTSGDPVDESQLEPAGCHVNAARLELPQFDAEDVDTWLLMCENLLLDAGISRQVTMFRKVLARLPPERFRMVKHLAVRHPLPDDCYDQLKNCLSGRLAIAPAERLRRLESLPPELGDWKPSQLYGQLEILYPDEDHSLAEVAFRADAHCPMRAEVVTSAVAIPPSDDRSLPSSTSDELVAAARRDRFDRPRKPMSNEHSRRPARSRGAVWPPGSQLLGQLHLYRGHDGKRTGPPVAAATTGRGSQCPLLFVRDTSGRRFLVDSGSEVSILPVGTPVSRAPLTNVPKLRAANGTLIDIFETDKFVELDLGLGRTYPFKFFVAAAVPEAILGADFLRAHGLVPDLRAARLYDRATFLSAACSTHPGTPADISSRTVHYVRHLPVFRSLLVTPGRFPAVAMPGVEHCICTRGAPVYARPRRLTPAKLAAARKELDELLKCGILVPSHSQWASPIHLVPKDKGARYRMVGCYERLNAVTIPDRYPVPDLQTFADRLHRATIFSKIDLARAYAQIRMSPMDQKKTAIVTPFGLYEYTRMPFGLRNAAQTFQRLMDMVFQGLPRVFVYIDDILMFSSTAQQHRADLAAVLERLRRYHLTIRPDKCIFGQTRIEFLGFELSGAGLRPLPDKVRDLLQLPPPTSVAECRRFIGMVNYYHRFIPRLASALLPLYQLANLSKRQQFYWRPEHDSSFREAKALLAEASTLAFPCSQAPTQVIADASENAVGAVIQQLQRNRWVPIAFHSKKLSDQQLKWSTGDKELFALVSAVRRFRHLLEGQQNLQFCTDHKPLIYAFSSKSERSARVQRQLAFLSEFSTDIRHIGGADNVVSDCLSRPPRAVSSTAYDVGLSDLRELAEEQQQSEDVTELSANRSLRVESRPVHGTSTPLLVDVSTGCPRPLVPRSLRRSLFDRLHNLHHPGTRATKRLICERFVWQGMSADIARWCKTCLRCQSSKIGRHQRTQLLRPPAPSSRFEALHVDIVGPLPPSRGFQFIFTIVDRYTRYPDAIPIKAATAAECARALLCWVSRFGMCCRVTSDRGRQFVSDLWCELCKLLGMQSFTTLASEPHQNGLVERIHRDIKASLIAVLQGDPTGSTPFRLSSWACGHRSNTTSDVRPPNWCSARPSGFQANFSMLIAASLARNSHGTYAASFPAFARQILHGTSQLPVGRSSFLPHCPQLPTFLCVWTLTDNRCSPRRRDLIES
ncbi:hypothetical protein M514_00667 [Trichuris suis]|uniref:RNA-directed DNA polymerase n=1 Tax=Trichuris suis TaxID=68888 RepID=A0A085N700_9BILA|nr:hypothetical protein M514_00667 [Trichuris suis]